MYTQDGSSSFDDSNHKAKGKNNRSKFRTGLRYVFTTFSFLFLSGLQVGGFVFGKAWISARKIFKGGGQSSVLLNKDVKPEELKGEGDGRVNVLLVGIGGGGLGSEMAESGF